MQRSLLSDSLDSLLHFGSEGVADVKRTQAMRPEESISPQRGVRPGEATTGNQ